MNKQYLQKLRDAGLGYCDYTYTNEDFKELAVVMAEIAQGYESKFKGMYLLNNIVVENKSGVLFEMSKEIDLSDYKTNVALLSIPEGVECFCISYERLSHFMPYLLQDASYTPAQYHTDMKTLEKMALDGYFWFVSQNFLMEKIVGHVRTLDTRISHNITSYAYAV